MNRKLKVISIILTTAMLFTASCFAVSAGDESGAVIEIVAFHIKSNVSPESLLEAARNITPTLESMPGFLSRIIGKGKEPGQWFDMVYWESMAQALQAEKAMEKKPELEAFLCLMSDFEMYHLTVQK